MALVLCAHEFWVMYTQYLSLSSLENSEGNMVTPVSQV